MINKHDFLEYLTLAVSRNNLIYAIDEYCPPYELPNGDIIIKRKIYDQEVEDDGTSPANAEFV